jgi:hypothetical protein
LISRIVPQDCRRVSGSMFFFLKIAGGFLENVMSRCKLQEGF